MPLYLTGARSSRVTKTRKPSTVQRLSCLPFPPTKQTQSLSRAQTIADTLEHDDKEVDNSLAGPGKTVSIIETPGAKDVVSAIAHARSTMFDELPDRAGMNSVRIAEVLNFQRNLPPVVSLAHIHALRSASSRTERDIQALLSSNQVRRIKLVGRGNEVSGLSEFLVSTGEYESLMRKSGMTDEVVSSFLDAMRLNPRVHALPASSMKRTHVDALTRTGFLVAPSIQGSWSSSARTSQSVVGPAAISRSASGSQAAVGGVAAFETLGGVNGARRTKSDAGLIFDTEYVLSVPGIAAYLQLLDAGRNHLIDLLRLFSKHRQAPVYLLKERWSGNVDDNNSQVSVAKRTRGEFSNVPPAKTKKWRQLNGLSFDWVLEECLGAGLIEVFETYSVGLGVRALV